MAEGSEEQNNDNSSKATVDEGKKNRFLFILTLLNSFLILGVLGIVFISFQKESKKQTVDDITLKTEEPSAHSDEKSHEGNSKKKSEFNKIITLDQFTINLSSLGGAIAKFARVNVSLEISSDELELEINAKIPQIRNVIIDLVNSKKSNELSTTDGRESLKEEIKNTINSFIVTGKIKGVYFTNFAISG